MVFNVATAGSKGGLRVLQHHDRALARLVGVAIYRGLKQQIGAACFTWRAFPPSVEV